MELDTLNVLDIFSLKRPQTAKVAFITIEKKEYEFEIIIPTDILFQYHDEILSYEEYALSPSDDYNAEKLFLLTGFKETNRIEGYLITVDLKELYSNVVLVSIN